jgi:hypothetical protein
MGVKLRGAESYDSGSEAFYIPSTIIPRFGVLIDIPNSNTLRNDQTDGLYMTAGE